MTINFAANFSISNSNKNICFPICTKITSIMHHNPLISNIVFPKMYSHNFIQNTFTKDCSGYPEHLVRYKALADEDC